MRGTGESGVTSTSFNYFRSAGGCDRTPGTFSQCPRKAGSEIKDEGAVKDEQQQQGQGGGRAIDDLHGIEIQKTVQ